MDNWRQAKGIILCHLSTGLSASRGMAARKAILVTDDVNW
jgi:hypothetical protein